MGVPIHSPLTLIDHIVEYKKNILSNLQGIYNYNKNIKSNNNLNNDMKKMEDDITSMKEQLSTLKERLTDISKDSCSICFENAMSYPCITPCCSKVFCGSCILEWLLRSNCCPLCRTSFKGNELIQISSETDPRELESLPTKLNALIDFIDKNPDGRFIVYSRFENTFLHLSEKFSTITFQGNKDSIVKILEKFEKGSIKVILFDNKYSGAGLNIQTATHFISMHKLPPQEKKSLLGRANRFGRKVSLEFIELLHEKE